MPITYTNIVQQECFDVMDPYKYGILAPGDAPCPIIRIFFALAARKPSINVVRHAPTTDYNSLIYDIWCAGLSPELFAPILHADIWDGLLQASYGWKDIYKGGSAEGVENWRSENPGAAAQSGHWSRWAIRRNL
jgi:hypothetical protein